jgi:hypothetical protein
MKVAHQSLIWLCGVVGAVGCAAHSDPAGEGVNEPECRLWQLTVDNLSDATVRVYVSGDGPEMLLGPLAVGERRTWTIAAEPRWVSVRDPLRGEARNVEVRHSCVGL